MPIILLSMFLTGFNAKLIAQNPIGKALHPVVGDLYHTGGNIGIGTDKPFKLLHLYSDTVTTFRLSSMCDRCDTTSWDLSTYQGILNFCYEDAVKCVPVMKLNEYGQLYLGVGNPVVSAAMQIESTSKGLLIPRMTTNNKNAITAPADGLLVYDTDLQVFSFYNTTLGGWSNIAKASDLSDYLLISDFNASVAGGITQSDTANWNRAYNFSQNFSESDPVFTSHVSSGITSTDISNWNTAFSWGNHADAGYLTSYTETDPIFTAWDKDYNDLTNIPDFTGWDTDASDDFDGQWASLGGTPPPVSTFANDAGYITDADLNYLWSEDNGGNVYVNNKNVYVNNGNFGIGTKTPEKSLEIFSVYNTGPGSLYKKSTIQLINKKTYYTEPKEKGIGPGPGPTPSDRIYKWEIENANNTVNFKYIDYDPNNIDENTEPETKFTFSGDGTLTATKFVGDGSGLTNIDLSGPIILDNSMESWTNSNWKARLQSTLGTVWASTNKSNYGNYYLGFGMTNSGWYFMRRFDDGDNKYVAVIREDGRITCKEVIIYEDEWKDNVFYNDYKLPDLEETEKFINKHHHLPDIPSEKEILKNGLSTGEMLKLQMQKIEELTLYIIEQNKRIKKLEEEISEQQH